MAWYNEYRPTDFESVVAQDTVKLILQNALEKGIFRHAYLFSGPKGTGKTSIARIFANKINNTDVNKEAKVDIVEMDAASNTGIDDIRNLIELSQTRPISGNYKIYIIDEVHMLSKNAMNAMLKVLEEPPEYLIFLLATTDPQKIIPTVLSRLTHLQLQSHTKADIIKLCRQIAVDKNINITDEALDLIAKKASGSHRDSINFLETIAGYKLEKYDADIVASLLSITPEHIFIKLTELVNHSTSRLELIKGLRQIDVSIKNLGIGGNNFLIEFLHFCLESNFEKGIEPIKIEIIIDLTNLVSQNLPIFDPSNALSLVELIVAKHSNFSANKITPSPLPIELLDSKKDFEPPNNQDFLTKIETSVTGSELKEIENSGETKNTIEPVNQSQKIETTHLTERNANIEKKTELTNSFLDFEDNKSGILTEEISLDTDQIWLNSEEKEITQGLIQTETDNKIHTPTEIRLQAPPDSQTNFSSKDEITKLFFEILTSSASPAIVKMLSDDIIVESFDENILNVSLSNGLFLSQINNAKILAWINDNLKEKLDCEISIEASVRNYKKEVDSNHIDESFVPQFLDSKNTEDVKHKEEKISKTSLKIEDFVPKTIEKSEAKPKNKVFYEVFAKLPEEIKDSRLPIFEGEIENPKDKIIEDDKITKNDQGNWEDEVAKGFDFE